MLIKKTSAEKLTMLPHHGASWASMSLDEARQIVSPRHHARLAAVAAGPVGGTLSYDETSGLAVGERVEGGRPGTEDHDTGRVVDFDGGQIDVAWDSGTRTRQRADLLRVVEV